MRSIIKLMLAGILILGVGMASLESNQAHAEENHDNTPQNVKLVGTYNADQVDSQTMQQFKNIEKEDNNFHVIRKNNQIIVEDVLPNPDNKKVNETANRSAKTDTKVINFSDFVGSMDGKDDGKIKDGTSFYSASYKGQKDGQKVKKGTHVHCNRFNGTKSDHRYWSKKHPKAYVDFYKSDCWYHAKAYKYSSIGKMTKCDGLNVKKKGVKDCSSWKGKPKHKNWPKTAWYRN
ncbi:hypothetical protein RJB33_12165 [Staphylococcus hominis]|nr:hypothetical protein [Staphylococcus hominis]MDS3899237.1 hypothetical protein [Staphylococcus hominis]